MLRKNFKTEFKTIILITSISIAILMGGINIFKSKDIIDKQSDDKLMLLTQNIGEHFNRYFEIPEKSLNAYSNFIQTTFSYDKLENKNKMIYINSYIKNILQPLNSDLVQNAEGTTGAYFIFDPCLMKCRKVIGVWYTKENDMSAFKLTDNGDSKTMYPENNPDLAWYYQPKWQKTAVWSNPYLDKDINVEMISYSRPVYVNNHFIGVAGVDIPILDIKNFIYKFKIFDSGYSYLLTKNYDMVINRRNLFKIKKNQNLKEINKNLYELIKKQLKKHNTGMISLKENEINKKFSFIRLRNGYIFMTEVPESEIYEQTNKLTTFLMLSIVFAIFISLIIARKADMMLKKTNDYLLHKEKLMSIGTLSAGIAHEINNPVAFILCNIDIFKKYMQKIKLLINAYNEFLENMEKSSVDISDKVKSITDLKNNLKINYIMNDIDALLAETAEGTLRVQQIVKNLKNFARDDISGEKTLENFNQIIEDALIIINNQIPSNIQIERNFQDVLEIMCNKNQIEQVIINLIMNAVHAIEEKNSSESGNIKISTYYDNKCLTCEISDNGTGIDIQLRNKIFDTFFTTKSVGKGTGLGLSIVQDIIVKKHKGDLFVNSEKGKGSIFIVKIPV